MKKSQNINLDAATIHIIGDIINSVGVIITAAIIYMWPHMWYLDPFCTYFFAILVMCTTYPVTSKCLAVLLEAVPDNIDIKSLHKDIWLLNDAEGLNHDLIKDVHDLHVWELSVNKVALTVHIKSAKP